MVYIASCLNKSNVFESVLSLQNFTYQNKPCLIFMIGRASELEVSDFEYPLYAVSVKDIYLVHVRKGGLIARVR